MSTAEPEYVSMRECCRELKRLQNVLADINLKLKHPAAIYSDTTAAIAGAKTEFNVRKSKHIEVPYQFFLHCIQSGHVIDKQISTLANKANFTTKPVSRVKFQKGNDLIGVI